MLLLWSQLPPPSLLSNQRLPKKNTYHSDFISQSSLQKNPLSSKYWRSLLQRPGKADTDLKRFGGYLGIKVKQREEENCKNEVYGKYISVDFD